MELSGFVFILLAFNSFCIFLDSWLLKREKKVLYNFLVRVFLKFDNLKIPDIHKIVASKISAFLDNLRAFRNRKIGFWFYALISSICLTFLSYYIGSFYDKSINPQFLSNEQYMIENGFFFLYFLIAILANAIFDLTSLSVTRYHIRVLGNSGYLKFLSVLLRDLVFALFLSIFLLDLVFYFSLYLDGLRLGIKSAYPSVIRVTFFHFDSILKVLSLNFKTVLSIDKIWIPFSYVVYSVTTFVPTFIFLSFLLIIYVSKVIVSSVRSIILRYIEKVTEENEDSVKPFTLIGISLSLVASILKIIIEYS